MRIFFCPKSYACITIFIYKNILCILKGMQNYIFWLFCWLCPSLNFAQLGVHGDIMLNTSLALAGVDMHFETGILRSHAQQAEVLFLNNAQTRGGGCKQPQWSPLTHQQYHRFWFPLRAAGALTSGSHKCQHCRYRCRANDGRFTQQFRPCTQHYFLSRQLILELSGAGGNWIGICLGIVPRPRLRGRSHPFGFYWSSLGGNPGPCTVQ